MEHIDSNKLHCQQQSCLRMITFSIERFQLLNLLTQKVHNLFDGLHYSYHEKKKNVQGSFTTFSDYSSICLAKQKYYYELVEFATSETFTKRIHTCLIKSISFLLRQHDESFLEKLHLMSTQQETQISLNLSELMLSRFSGN